MTITEAILAVETTQTALASADGADQAAGDKLAAAQAAKAKTASDDAVAVAAANDALDAASALFLAAKRPVPPPPA